MRDSYRLWQLKENMINHLVLLFFIANVFTFPLAADEVNMLPLETSPSLRSYVKPTLPQLNINYDAIAPDTNRSEYLKSLHNFEKDGSTYCPHVEILTIILNELRNLLPQSSEKIKDVLSKYYNILENTLNSRYSVETLNKFSSENRLHYMDFLVQKLLKMDNKNANIKISFEYELPTIHKQICAKLCNDILNFANNENSLTMNGLNYADEQGKMKNNIMTLLQNYRPDNNNSPIMNKPDYFYPPNSDTDSSNPTSPNMPFLNPLQSVSQQLANHKELVLSDHLQNLSPFQSPTETDFYSSQNLSLPLPTSEGKAKFNFFQYFATLPQNLKGTGETVKHFKQNLLPQWLYPKEKKSISMLQTYPGSSNSYPVAQLSVGLNPSHMLPPRPNIPNGIANHHAFLNYANPRPNLNENLNPLLNADPLPHNPIELEDSYHLQNLPPQLQGLEENSKDIENFAKQINLNHNSNQNSQYHYETQNFIHHNKDENAVQFINKNNKTVTTPRTSEDRWGQPNYLSANNKYSNDVKLLQKKLIQSFNQHKPLVPNLILQANKRDPANLYHNLNTNILSSIKQYESGKLQMDSTSAQASTLDHYKQYLQSVKNLIYPQTNPANGYLLSHQIPYSSQNIYPFSYEKKNKLYNSFVKKYYQLPFHSNIPSRLDLYPNSNYHYYPNLGITNNAKNTQESYGVQFQDLNRLLGVSNLHKLNSVSNKNGIVELTYKLNNSKHSDEPFIYVKFKLPFNVFLFNLNKILLEKPNLRNNLSLLYKHLLIGSNITSSSVIKSLNKDELLRLVSTNDTIVTAKVLDANDTPTNEQIKIVQKINANMPVQDIVKSNANITKVSDFTTKIPALNYLRDPTNYLDNLHRTMAVNKYFLNPYKIQAYQNYNQYVPRLTYLNRKPTPQYNYIQNKPFNPYSSNVLNSFSKYYRYRG